MFRIGRVAITTLPRGCTRPRLITPPIHTPLSHYTTTMSASDFYNLKAEKPNGEEYKFDSLKDKVVLVVNTASELHIGYSAPPLTAHQANAGSRPNTLAWRNYTTSTKIKVW